MGSDDGSISTTRSERMSGAVLRQPSIPQSSRLLQPTLSWQAKATFIPETFSALTAKQLEDIAEQADSDAQSEASTAAMSTKSLAAFTARRSSTSWKQRASRSSDGELFSREHLLVVDFGCQYHYHPLMTSHPLLYCHTRCLHTLNTLIFGCSLAS